MPNDHLIRPFIAGSTSAAVSLLLFGVAACFGQVVIDLVQQQLWEPQYWDEWGYYVGAAILKAPFSWGLAVLSGLGSIFALSNGFCLYALLHSGHSKLTLLSLVATNQIGATYSIWLVFDRDSPWEYHGLTLVALGVLWALCFLAKKIVASCNPRIAGESD